MIFRKKRLSSKVFHIPIFVSPATETSKNGYKIFLPCISVVFHYRGKSINIDEVKEIIRELLLQHDQLNKGEEEIRIADNFALDDLPVNAEMIILDMKVPEVIKNKIDRYDDKMFDKPF